MDLTGFVVFDFSEGVPYFTVTPYGVTFNKSTVLKLGLPAYVRVLINEKTKQVALQACEKTDPQAVRFYRQNKRKVLMIRFSSHSLLKTFKDLFQSDLRQGFRVEGKLVEPGLVLFDLEKARPLDGRFVSDRKEDRKNECQENRFGIK